MSISSLILKILTHNKSKGWISTYTGKEFYPCQPEVEKIDIHDIAHALSNICRFTGHCKNFYSVAQHCVLVSYFCNKEDDLEGLMHDGTEAYLCDIARPIKILKPFFFYRMIEKNLYNSISRKFNLKLIEPKSVKIADTRILGNEMQSLMNVSTEHYMQYNPYPCIPRISIDYLPERRQDVEHFDKLIKPWNNKTAELIFLTRFYQLQEKRKNANVSTVNTRLTTCP